MMCDKHVVKMIVEYAQILSTAQRVLDGTPTKRPSKSGQTMQTHYQLRCDRRDSIVYKATHVKHPSSVWARECSGNYQWLYDHFLATCTEYKKRYGKEHATFTKLRLELWFVPRNILHSRHQTPLPQCMPDQYKHDDAVTAYRQYYAGEKSAIATYRYSEAPEFMAA